MIHANKQVYPMIQGVVQINEIRKYKKICAQKTIRSTYRALPHD